MARSLRNLPPYAAGAGINPPKFAGREDILDEFDAGLEALERGRYANPHAVIGARGLGKTVLLNELATIAQERGWQTASIEIQQRHRLEHQLLDALNEAIAGLAPTRAALMTFRERVAATTKTLSITTTSLAPISISWTMTDDLPPERAGVDLNRLIIAVGELARDKGSGVALFLDELHETPAEELTSLAVALQALSKQRDRIPVQVTGAGLPLLVDRAMNAGTYGERMFELWELQPFTLIEVADALRVPAQNEGRDFTPQAVERIFAETRGYPFFVQRWGIEVWRTRPEGVFTVEDVEMAQSRVIESLDRSFFRMRTSRLTPRELEYVGEMADLPEGRREAGVIAKRLGVKTPQLSMVRDSLIRKGVIDSPARGFVEFTVPGYDAYLKRSGIAQNRG
ncbi:MAG: ATP-binding protein [Actinobacteria bacterium]|nr:ATP-binding protein [Actinomycetota bacterium]